MLTEADILQALRDCYDPEIPCNIVDLGIIRSVAVRPDPEAPGIGIPGVPQKHNVTISLTPTNRTEATEAHLFTQIANRLAGMETVGRTEIIIVPNPPWTPQSITPAGRRTLGLDGNPTLVQIR